MARRIPELRLRHHTDRRLSFGSYLVIMVSLVALIVVTTVVMMVYWARQMMQYPDFFPPGPYFPSGPYSMPPFGFFAVGGWLVAVITVTAALTIIYWWYQWQLYRRRNEHIERAKRLRARVAQWLHEEYGVATSDWAWPDTHLTIREQYRSTGFFVLWVVLNYVFGIVGYVLTLIAWYWLTVDYYVHEQGELEFYRRVAAALKEKGVHFHAEVGHSLIPRNMVLYVVLMIIPGVNLVWSVWWSYVLFADGNAHFDTHDAWERQLERLTGQVQAPPEAYPEAPASPRPPARPFRAAAKPGKEETPLEILQQRYARGELTREEFEQMKRDLSEE